MPGALLHEIYPCMFDVMDTMHAQIVAAGDVSRAPSATPIEPGGMRPNKPKQHQAERARAKELWNEIAHQATRQETCRRISQIIIRETGNTAITEYVVTGWARRGEFDR